MIKIATFWIFVGLLFGCSHPSDRELEQRFLENRMDFVKLARMLDEDKTIVVLSQESIFYTGKSPRSISLERLSEYRALLRKLKLDGGIHRDNSSSVNLIVSSKGFPIQSSGKAFFYSTEEVTPVVDSLDSIIQNDRGDTRPSYKIIEKNWYLVYESW